MKNYILIVAVLSVWPLTALALDSFSYSGRLVNNNGSPVAGPVDLRFDLSSTVPLAGTLCTKTITGVQLSQGVFHVKLKFDPADCGGDAFQDVMETIPSNQNMTYQVTDITNSRTYAVQNMYAVPSSFMANFAKNLPQMGALPNQVLKWDDSSKRWLPGSAGTGDGTVKSISTDASLTGGPITDTGTLAVAVGGITNAHLAGGIDPAKLAGTRDGTTYLKGDNTWSVFGTEVLGTLLTGFSAASTSVVTATDSILAALGKLQGQVTDLEDNKLSKTGGTLSVGTINGVPTPLFNDQVANKKYVDDQIGGVNSSQWLDAAPHIYFNTGNVGIGTGAPAEKLDVVGNIALTGRLRLKDSGSNFVELRAPLTTTGVTLVLPASTGTNGQVLKTDGTGNLSWGNSSVGSSDITDGSIVDADISATADIDQSKIANLTSDLAAKQNLITAGTTAQYWRGDKTWQTLNTDVVPEGTTNKYFSNTLARGAISATSPISYNNSTGEIGMVSGATGDLLRYNGTNWVPWAPNYLTAEADTLATVTGRGATTSTAVTLSGGASFPNNGIWNASGSVGIGINAPTSLLDVTNTSNTVANYLMRLKSNTTNGVNTDTNVLIDFAESNGSNVQEWVLGTGSNTFFGHPDNFGLRTKTYNWNAFVVNPAGGGRLYLAPAGGRVGIGTTTARSTLEVAGGVQIGNDAATCDASKVGTLRYNSANVEYCNGSTWAAFGVSGSGITNFNGSTVGSHSLATPGTTGTAPNWVTVPASGVHTLHIPMANAAGVTAGLLSKTDYDSFSAKLGTATALSGDVSGTYNATSVDKIKGTSVAVTSLASGNLLRYNGTNWVNTMLGASDIPNLDAGKITSGLLPVARGGTNNGTLSGNRIMVSTATSIVEAPAMTNGQLLIGSTGATPVPATLTAGTGVTITNSAGGITIAAAGSGGTVTNVTGTAPISVATGSSTPVVSISQATTSTNGYLSSTDWNIFNNKQAPLSTGLTINGVTYPASGAQNLQVSNAPVNMTDVVNLQALNNAMSGITTSQWLTSGSNIYYNTGNVGVGTAAPTINDWGGPSRVLHIHNSDTDAGTDSTVGLHITNGTTTAAKNRGLVFGRWPDGTNTLMTYENERLVLATNASPVLTLLGNGNVGIGSTSPAAKLEVTGQVKITGGAPGVGKVLTSDATGLATWTSIAPGGVTSVSGTAPVTVTGATTPVVSMAAATTSANGYLTSADWNTFNSKLGTTTALSGDVSGTYNATSVDKIKATAVTITSLTSGNLLKFNGTAWVNAMLGASDIPNLDAGKITTGLLPVARGGTNNGTLSGNRIMVSTGTSIVEAPAMTNGQLLIGSTGATPVAATLTAGTGVSITNSAGGITINATGSGGTVTNVTGTAPISVATGTSTPVVSISQATTSTNGYLSSADWNTFNNKQAPLSTGPTINNVTYPASGAQNLQVSNAPVNLTDVVNLQALNTAIGGIPASQWATNGSNIYNNNSGSVGIGTSTPFNPVMIGGARGVDISHNGVALLQLKSANSGSTPLPLIHGIGQRGTLASPSNLVAGDSLLKIMAGGYTSGLYDADAANIEFIGESFNSGDIFSAMIFRTAQVGNPVERLRINSAGDVGIGTSTPGAKLEVAGQVKITGGSPGAGKVLTSDAAGLATWTTPAAGGDFMKDGSVAMTGVFRALPGSSSLPGISFNGDTNTGISAATADTLVFSTNGTNNVTIAPSGNVGIGTSTPGSALSVNSGNTKTTLHLTAMGGGGYLSARGNTSHLDIFGGYEYDLGTLDYRARGTSSAGIELDGVMKFFTNTGLTTGNAFTPTERMRIDTSGNVGIGTTSPGAKLEVAGQVKITGGSPGAGKVLTSDASGLATWQTSSGTGDFKSDGTVAMTGQFRAATGTYTNPGMSFAASTDSGFIYGGTNLGVILNGSSVAGFYASGFESFFRITAPNGTANDTSYGFSSGNGIGMFRPATNTLGFSTSANERVRISATGDVGIGTTTPGSKLAVAGAITTPTNIIASGNAVNLALSNIHLLQSVGSSTINMTNLVNGGVYTIIISDTASRTYTFSGCNSTFFNPANAATTAAAQTIFGITTVQVGGNWHCYVAWSSGFQ